MIWQEVQKQRLHVLLQAVQLESRVIVNEDVFLLSHSEHGFVVEEADIPYFLLDIHLAREFLAPPVHHCQVPSLPAQSHVLAIPAESASIRPSPQGQAEDLMLIALR